MFKSATFAIGILLAIGAFVGFLFLGNFLAPPPANVVVALHDISPYTPLDENMLGVDAQHMNGQVLATLIEKSELEQYIGGFVTTPIYAGEPLRKSAIVMRGNPLASKRLALALTDRKQVAAVIPVDPKSSPSQIVTGDYVDLVISMAPGNLLNSDSNKFGELLAGKNDSVGLGPSAVITTTRNTGFPSPISATGVFSGLLPGEEMNLPVTKAVIRSVPVLAVAFDQTPNPAYASAGFADEQSNAPAQPAYINGEIKSITVSVPRESAELLSFGIDNGKVHILLLSIERGQTEFVAQKTDSTLGVSWNDVLAFMIKEREDVGVALNAATTANNGTNANQTSATNPNGSSTTNGSSNTNPTPANPTAAPTKVNPTVPPPTSTPVAALSVPTSIAGIANQIDNAINGGKNNPEPPAGTNPPQQNQLATGPDLMAMVTPLVCGFTFLVLAIVVIRIVRRRRTSNATV